MTIDVYLLNSGILGSVGRHGSVGSFIMGIGTIQTFGFFRSLELFDESVGIFGIIFCDQDLDTGGVKKEHGSFGSINILVDWFGQINETVEHQL